MAIEYFSQHGRLIWIRNPFTGFVSYFVDYDKTTGFEPMADEVDGLKLPNKRWSELNNPQVQTTKALCPFCPGNESKVLPDLLRLGPDEIEGLDGDDSSPWTIRVFNNLFPRIPSALTGGRNESYVLVEDPRHFLPGMELASNLLYSGALTEAHFIRLFEVHARIVEQSLANPTVKYVVVRKNQGHESGASQPHVHQQIVGSPMCFPAVESELRALRYEPNVWKELIAIVRDFGLIIEDYHRVVSYASPMSVFPQSYDVVMPECAGTLNELDTEDLRLFARTIHRILRFLGPIPLEYEIHQGERQPIHAHINVRRSPYAILAGTVIAPRRILSQIGLLREMLERLEERDR